MRLIIRLFLLPGLFFSVSAAAVTPQVAAGYDHSIGLGADGKVYGWGNNASGQLGLGHPLYSAAPQAVTDFNLGQGAGKSRLAVGISHNVTVRSDGSIWAWGDNSYGQLGDGTGGEGNKQLRPVQITLAAGFVA